MRGELRPGHILLLVAVFYPGCKEQYEVLDESARETGAQIRVKDFRTELVTPLNVRKWSIEAEEAFLYRAVEGGDRPLIVYRFVFREYEEGGAVRLTIRGDRGERNPEDDVMRVEGNIRYEHSSGRVVTAESMRYSISEKVARSDSAVTILERGLTTRCRAGAVIDTERERQVCRSPYIVRQAEERVDDGAATDAGEVVDVFE